jgi:hypothetical protein
MDSLNRIFASINEAKKAKKSGKGKAMIPSHHEKKGGEETPKGKKNPYDHDSFGMRAESSHLSPKQKKIAKVAGDPTKIDAADLAALRARKKKKVNASTEIANILNLIKEAYQDELISEEAFLAIADPIVNSLMEEAPSGEKASAGPDGPKKVTTGKSPLQHKNPTKARKSSHSKIARTRKYRG